MRKFETVVVGKAELQIDQFGTVKFLDDRGHLRRADGDPVVLALIRTIQNGSGEPHVTIHKEGSEPPTNVVTRRYGNPFPTAERV